VATPPAAASLRQRAPPPQGSDSGGADAISR